ncbi:hypothetical protein [Fodinicola feengrottensis]|uniref:DUF2127 domain-containing protein n=1 Tax=Fodinicola feengrottensis TaxID=435914 RepID=A0ABN2HQL4_9ACTN|nr:hypothetical protein [Fodinicola feengrottensis]
MSSVRDDEPTEPEQEEAAEAVVVPAPPGLSLIKDEEPDAAESDDDLAGQRNVSVFRGRVVGEEPLGLAGAPTPLRVARWIALGLAVAGTIGGCGAGAEVVLLSLAGLHTSFVSGLAAIVAGSLVLVWLQAWLVDRAARRRSSGAWFWSVALCWLTLLALVAAVIAGWVTIPAAAGGVVINVILLGCLQFHRDTRRYLGEDL